MAGHFLAELLAAFFCWPLFFPFFLFMRGAPEPSPGKRFEAPENLRKSEINGFERALIQETVRAGLRNARAKGKRLGRPPVVADAVRIASLRSQGHSWAQIKAEVGVSKGAAQRAVAGLPKIV